VSQIGALGRAPPVRYDGRSIVESAEHRPSDRWIPATRWPVGVLALVLACGVAVPAAAQIRCQRDGDWLTCEDGGRYGIRNDRDVRWRSGLGRAAILEAPIDRPGETGTTDRTLLYSSDGQICWRHGDHAHCQ
jgi:hypothetical protein